MTWLGKYIVADPLVCHGEPTFRGTRIMVWQVRENLVFGMSHDEIVKAWGGRISLEAIAEASQLNDQIMKANSADSKPKAPSSNEKEMKSAYAEWMASYPGPGWKGKLLEECFKAGFEAGRKPR